MVEGTLAASTHLTNSVIINFKEVTEQGELNLKKPEEN